MTTILLRMKELGITQVEMLQRLNERGRYTVQPPELSQILRGIATYPKAKEKLNECNRILAEIELGSDGIANSWPCETARGGADRVLSKRGKRARFSKLVKRKGNI
ncbi:hypothetical protein FACS189499_06710 [Clostridia bacterium]|nr:hypothetical protein FACS189499_06710 [Clostridia bacterium]